MSEPVTRPHRTDWITTVYDNGDECGHGCADVAPRPGLHGRCVHDTYLVDGHPVDQATYDQADALLAASNAAQGIV